MKGKTPAHSKLLKLDLRGNTFDSEVVKYFCKFLENNKSLENLRIQSVSNLDER